MSGRSPYDTLRALFMYYGPDDAEMSLDPETPFDGGLAQYLRSGYDLNKLRVELATLVALDVPDLELHHKSIPLVPIPAGGSIRSFLRYLDQRLAAAQVSPPAPGENVGLLLPGSAGIAHRSRFPSMEVANDSATAALRANEAALREWVETGSGVPRLHLVADLGRPLGWVSELDESGRPVGDPVETGTCVVVMGVVDPSDRAHPTVLTCYPELAVDVAVRRRWPALVALFGGFFNQDVRARDRTHWAAEHRYHQQVGPEVESAVIEQLAGLLAATDGDDAALTAALHSLGSCTLPVNPRRWVRGLRRRMTDLDWTA